MIRDEVAISLQRGALMGDGTHRSVGKLGRLRHGLRQPVR